MGSKSACTHRSLPAHSPRPRSPSTRRGREPGKLPAPALRISRRPAGSLSAHGLGVRTPRRLARALAAATPGAWISHLTAASAAGPVAPSVVPRTAGNCISASPGPPAGPARGRGRAHRPGVRRRGHGLGRDPDFNARPDLAGPCPHPAAGGSRRRRRPAGAAAPPWSWKAARSRGRPFSQLRRDAQAAPEAQGNREGAPGRTGAHPARLRLRAGNVPAPGADRGRAPGAGAAAPDSAGRRPTPPLRTSATAGSGWRSSTTAGTTCTREQQSRDNRRDESFNAAGWRYFKFNADDLADDFRGAVQRVRAALRPR